MPREVHEGEKRVAATPESVKKLRELGFEVAIERGAGLGAGHDDAAYQAAGALLLGRPEILSGSDLVVKVRPPVPAEVELLKEGGALVSLLQPEREPDLPERLARRRVSALALERIPRVTRAQKMDVLSSMANLAGYRAVIEAATRFPGIFAPQVTAAGTSPPARVLIIGAGVAGLAAIAAARGLGAEVRAFDTRAATREQVESLGARFLTVQLAEEGEGGGGYAREMSPAFIAAEMALFRAQAAEVDIIVTTALVPGKKAPVLLTEEVVAVMRRGSVIVDLAAEQGGNCALTVPGQAVERGGVTILGYTDLPSRMAPTASRLFSANVVHVLVELGGAQGFRFDLDNDVVRPALVTHAGQVLPRPEPKAVAPPPPRARAAPPPEAKPVQQDILSPTRRAWGATVGGMLLIVVLFFIGRFAPRDFLQHSTVFILACFVGWQVIWSVTPALHTPLMSVTNAISGIIILGGMVQIGASLKAPSILGAIAALLAAVNIAGGFLVTQRMLRMFRKDRSR